MTAVQRYCRTASRSTHVVAPLACGQVRVPAYVRRCYGRSPIQAAWQRLMLKARCFLETVFRILYPETGANLTRGIVAGAKPGGKGCAPGKPGHRTPYLTSFQYSSFMK